jgi:hypothetical protein
MTDVGMSDSAAAPPMPQCLHQAFIRSSRMTHRYKNAPQDKQAGLTGKVENDFNKIGKEEPTQKNQGNRTPQSRSDREDHIGVNQSQARRNAPNSGASRAKR